MPYMLKSPDINTLYKFQSTLTTFGCTASDFSAGLSNTLHYIGSYNDPADYDNPTPGDVVTSGGNHLVFSNGRWVELGQNTNDLIVIPQDCEISSMHANNYQDAISELAEKVDALSKQAIPRFHCVYCGTQNFEYSGIATTPQCPNCGALMRRTDESILADTKALYCKYPSF